MLSAVGHHLKKSASRVIVLIVLLEMKGESVDALSEYSHLDLGRARVLIVLLHLLDYCSLFLNRKHGEMIAQP